MTPKRLSLLFTHFETLARTIPEPGQRSAEWQEAVVEAVGECFDEKADQLRPGMRDKVDPKEVVPFKQALRKLRKQAGSYSSRNNAEIREALGHAIEIIRKAQAETDGTTVDTLAQAEGEQPKWLHVADLGGGGQGLTSKVRNRDTHELGVRKILRERAWAQPEQRTKALRRFRREIETTRSLNHPLILRVLDASLDTDEPWAVTEYMPLGTVHDHCAVYRGDAWRSLRLVRDVAVALEALHKRGLTHRDVKPSNILLRDVDHPVLGDFGIVHDADATDLTSIDEVVGAKGFMPPEAEDGRLDDPPASFDVYSLGKVLWTILSGGPRLPRERFRDPQFDLVAQLNRPELESVNRLLAGMIAESPQARFQTMTEVIAAIDLALAELVGGGATDLCRVCRIGRYEPGGHLRGTSGPSLGDYDVCKTCGDMRIYQPAPRKSWRERPLG